MDRPPAEPAVENLQQGPHHVRIHHASCHLGHRPEGHAQTEQGVEIRLLRRDGSFCLAPEDLVHQPPRPAFCIAQLGEGVVFGEGRGTVPFGGGDGPAQQGRKLLASDLVDLPCDIVGQAGQIIRGLCSGAVRRNGTR